MFEIIAKHTTIYVNRIPFLVPPVILRIICINKAPKPACRGGINNIRMNCTAVFVKLLSSNSDKEKPITPGLKILIQSKVRIQNKVGNQRPPSDWIALKNEPGFINMWIKALTNRFTKGVSERNTASFVCSVETPSSVFLSFCPIIPPVHWKEWFGTANPRFNGCVRTGNTRF